MRRWLQVLVLSVALAVPAEGPGLAVLAGLAAFTATDAAEARSSSGGYSRPSTSSSSRSYSAPRAPSSSAPSSSGGYSRPRTPSVGYPEQRKPSVAAPVSPGDRAMSRSGSGSALERYQAQKAPPPPAATTTPAPSRDRSYSGGSWNRSTWYGDRGWSPPPYAYQQRPSFGVWDAMLMWFLLDTLTSPGHAAFFHNHRDDPGYREWRAEAESRAQTDPEMKAKLSRLDGELKGMEGQPRDSKYLPPDVPARAALAETQQDKKKEGGSGWGLWLVLALLAGFLFILWRARRRPRREGDTVEPLKTAGNFLRGKFGSEPYKPSLFRVGMTVTLDPTPFLLAAGATKVEAPAGGLTSVEAVGTVGSNDLHRLYLPGGRSFLQLHLDAQGQPDECRYFTTIDEVAPADEDEWGFWLDDAEGMIGWPEFQTKDGKAYPRAWNPGGGRVQPKLLTEVVKTVQGTATRTLRTMLYALPTGIAEPGPQTEYLLVTAVEEGGQAWVELAAGIDVNPASLSLA